MTDPPLGWQIVELETDNPPAGLPSYAVYSLEFCLGWLRQSPQRGHWRLLPVWPGDIEEVSDRTSEVLQT